MRTHLKNFRTLFFLLVIISVLSFDLPAKEQNKTFFVPATPQLSVADTGKASLVIAPNATIKLISKDFGFSEGPASNKKGEVFFSDQPNDIIWKYSNDGKLSVFLDKTGRSNGMYFDKKGNLISCADEKNEIWSINPSGKVTILLTGFQGKRLNGPNDLWIDNKGGIYFTDPYYQRPYWDRKAPDIKAQNVYYLPKGSKEAKAVDTTLMQPNGIVGTRDGKYLYVADIRGRKTYRYTMNGDGTLKDKQLFLEQGSDGMAIDNKGNIYLCGNGVSVYNSEGKKIEQIAVPSRSVTNVCFSGKKNDVLFITAVEAVYTLQMKVKGKE
jgi:gluconolactonase